MKFTKGRWIYREGITARHTGQIREVRTEGNKICLYTVSYINDARGMGGPAIEIYLSAPDVIRVEACHFLGTRRKMPEFELNTTEIPLITEDTREMLSVKSGDLELKITKRPCDFTFYYKGKKMTSIDTNPSGLSMISTIQVRDEDYMRREMDLDLVNIRSEATKTNNFMAARMRVEVGEKIYGLGERFTPFVKNGQTVDSWNEDGGTNTNIAYKSIPFYISNRGYGVLVNDSGPVSYEICSESVTGVQFAVPGEKLDFMVIGGNDMKGVLSNYTSITGKPALPPAWSFGLWLSTSFTTNYDEETVLHFVGGMKERNIPLRVFHFDCFWMRENEWCNFKWDDRMFPDIEGQLRRMKEEYGLKICVWINPYIGQKSPLFKEAMDAGYLLQKDNGDVWQWDIWQAGLALVDFTNPDARSWYQEKLEALLKNGVDCVKTDFGERIPTNVTYFDGSDPLRMHNFYTYLYNKCVFEAIKRVKGEREALVFARSATVGGQKFPVHWGGDCDSKYLSMAETLRGGLSLCLSGFGFWSHDISGFEGTASADLYKRWVAFGMLSTHSRLHGSKSYRVPWLFSEEGEQNGEESVAVLRHFTELKCRLMPYIFASAVYTHNTGIPVMRAMVLEFPEDICCEDLDRQYMFGENLLVAPVFSKEGDVAYYLPEGEWTHLLSGEVKQGGKWYKETYDFFSLPLFVRENAILPIGGNSQLPDYDYTDNLTLEVFCLKDKAEAVVCDTEGNKALHVTAIRDGDAVKISIDGNYHNLKIRMVNVCGVQNVSGARVESSARDVLLCVEERDVFFNI